MRKTHKVKSPDGLGVLTGGLWKSNELNCREQQGRMAGLNTCMKAHLQRAKEKKGRNKYMYESSSTENKREERQD